MLNAKQLREGVVLAERERVTRWEWGDWAVSVAGAVGEKGHGNESKRKLTVALEEVARANDGSIISDLPSAAALRSYREAASAIPPSLRDRVRSVDTGRMLGQLVPDIRERHALIERLASEHPRGIVTVDAARAALGKPQTNTGKVQADHATVEEVREALADPDVRAEVIRTPEGVSSVLAAARAIEAQEPSEYTIETLPHIPSFMQEFWRAVTSVRIAHEVLVAHGVNERLMDPDAREAAERLHRQAGELAAAVQEAAIEQSI